MFALLLQTPAIPPETKQFDFWLGHWTCEGTLYGQKETHTVGSNKVTLDFDGHVIHEHFKMPGMTGESWSVYVPAAGKWRQTWVDNSGGYIPLSGTWADGKMTLTTPPNPATPETFNHMVYSNITPTSFDWDWERTTDGGKTWKTAWHLHYTRKKWAKVPRRPRKPCLIAP